MFVAYWDESETGQGDSAVFTLACLVAPIRCWEERFTPRWNAAMARGGAAGKVLHMKELVHGVGDFMGWRDAEKQKNLLKRLSPVICPNISLGFCGSVHMKALKEEFPAGDQNDTTDAFLYTLGAAMQLIVEELHPSAQHPVICFMEQNKVIEFEAIRHFYHKAEMFGWKHVFPSITPIAKGPAPLQAVDMVAYEGSRYSSEHVVGTTDRPVRKLYNALDNCPKLRFSTASHEIIRESAARLMRTYHAAQGAPDLKKRLWKGRADATKRAHRERRSPTDSEG